MKEKPFYSPEANVKEIKIIRSLNTNKATRPDGISGKIVKHSANVMDNHLSNIISNDNCQKRDKKKFTYYIFENLQTIRTWEFSCQFLPFWLLLLFLFIEKNIGGCLCNKLISNFLPHLSFNWRTFSRRVTASW